MEEALLMLWLLALSEVASEGYQLMHACPPHTSCLHRGKGEGSLSCRSVLWATTAHLHSALLLFIRRARRFVLTGLGGTGLDCSGCKRDWQHDEEMLYACGSTNAH